MAEERDPRGGSRAADRLVEVLQGGADPTAEPTAEERLRLASERLERQRVRAEEAPRVYFRSPRGGHCPLDARGRRELLALYGGFGISVAAIADHFGVGSGTIYRWLILLGVQAQDRATPAELARMAEARALARRGRGKR